MVTDPSPLTEVETTCFTVTFGRLTLLLDDSARRFRKLVDTMRGAHAVMIRAVRFS